MIRRALAVAVASSGLLLIAGCASSHDADTPSPAVTAHVSAQPGNPGPATTSTSGAVASPGCHQPSPPEETNRQVTMQVSGVTRSYLLTTPPAHSSPEPLVVDFHGYSEGAQTEALATQFSPLAQQDGFLVVFPNGTGTPIAWNTSTARSNPDLHFVAILLDRLESTQCIDESRVYATGLSQGAFMTSTVACTMSSRFAAVAPVAGVQMPKHCDTSRAVPLLAFHGTADPILHFNGGLGRQVLRDAVTLDPKPFPRLPAPRLGGPGYPAAVRSWAAKDGCRSDATTTRLSPHVLHRAYPCPAGVAVEFDIILGGGHTWPGSAFDAEIRRFVGHTTTEINATTTIWTFFKRFHLTA